MSKKLLIVESPAKAKTIEKYLDGTFKVKSSVGHIRDLDKGDKGIDIDKGFEPSYVVSPEKTKVVKDLKSAAKSASEVWLATDEDREGEAIAWHLCKVLDLDEHTAKRIVFREITKTAIQKAVLEPRTVDLNLVNAQQARRILDRLVGFELSGVLWRKVKNKLSAGRVQSVAVKLIVERERDINEFTPEQYYRVTAVFNVKDKNGRTAELKAELKRRLGELDEAQEFAKACNGATFTIGDISKKPIKRRPAAPFTTSTLQQDASRKLGFAVRRTMSAAQRLYEQGFITYMRTDSTSLSAQATKAIEEEIKSQYGERYHKYRTFKSKKENIQEAHEAIRPTYIERPSQGAESDQRRLYELIWKRTIASQMADAEIEKTTVKIGISTLDDQLQAEGEVLTFDGFLKVYMEAKDDDDESEAKGMLPPLKVGQDLDLNELLATQRFTKAPARYTEASLVKKLEEQGIGRPSTYAPTISKIMEAGRGYVTKESREGIERKYNVVKLADLQVSTDQQVETTGATSNRLYPSDLGMVVVDFLDGHFEQVMDYKFTAEVEDRLDKVATGGQDWRTMLKEFYGPFHETVEHTLEHAERAKGTRELGTDEETGHTIMATMTRYGPVIQIGTREEVGEEGKPKFANLKPGQSIATINLEDAMDLFELPKTLGEFDGKIIEINRGRYGPYVKYEDKFVSIPRDEDPLKMSLARAVELVQAKLKEEEPVTHYEGEPVTKGKGRFGPFLKYKSMFVNIPRRYDPDTISVDDMHELIQAKIEKEANRYIHQWPAEKITVENGRWGPFIKFKKKNVKIPKKKDGERVSAEEAKEMTLEDVKKLIVKEIPDAFKAPKKKAPAKKKKAATKKK
jgi:DNA topoisomerase-1